MKKFIVVLLALFLGACSPQAHVLVKNDCHGAYLRITRIEGAGDAEVVRERLLPGERINVSLTGTAGSQNRFIVTADGFRLSNNQPLGSAQFEVWVSPSNGPTAPSNNYNWTVNWLYPVGCPGN